MRQLSLLRRLPFNSLEQPKSGDRSEHLLQSARMRLSVEMARMWSPWH